MPDDQTPTDREERCPSEQISYAVAIAQTKQKREVLYSNMSAEAQRLCQQMPERRNYIIDKYWRYCEGEIERAHAIATNYSARWLYGHLYEVLGRQLTDSPNKKEYKHETVAR